MPLPENPIHTPVSPCPGGVFPPSEEPGTAFKLNRAPVNAPSTLRFLGHLGLPEKALCPKWTPHFRPSKPFFHPSPGR